MHFGTMCTKQGHVVTGVLYDVSSVYEGLNQLSDLRKAREKLSKLETVLMILGPRNCVGMVSGYFAAHISKAFSMLTPHFSTLRKPCIETWSSMVFAKIQLANLGRITSCSVQGGEMLNL